MEILTADGIMPCCVESHWISDVVPLVMVSACRRAAAGRAAAGRAAVELLAAAARGAAVEAVLAVPPVPP